MKKLVHIMTHEKFTSGYVNFMYHVMTEWEHTFIFLEGDPKIDAEDGMDIIRISSYVKLLTDAGICRKLMECDQIVVDGVFGVENLLFFYPRRVWKKILLFYWGGDFYQYRNIKKLSKWVHKQIFAACARKCRGWIFLYEGEIEKFRQLIHGEKPTYIARMPVDPIRQIDRKSRRCKPRMGERYRILVGNSATASNHHREIFELLARYPLEKMEVLVPLSYGNEPVYRDQVLREGREILGEAFHPMTEFMDKTAYVDFLSTVDVGIFNNDRQQGMGNINILFSLGKKVYLRQDTTMWEKYTGMGYRFFSVSSLADESLEELTSFSAEAGQQNGAVFDAIDATAASRKEWEACLEMNKGDRQ